ncbi:MAG: hypothetical protein KF822_11235 [Steroidobacteraceae bacterium]|nr:hypothetical protein [Steroidobacteraceae bacterium]
MRALARTLALLLLPFPATAAEDAPLRQATVRLFEQADVGVQSLARRAYATHFDSTRMRWLGVEISGTYDAPAQDQLLPVECLMRRPDGTLVPTARDMSFQLFAGETESSSANVLWGVEDEDDWPAGAYEVECAVAGHKLDAAKFEVIDNPSDVVGTDIRVAEMRFFPVVQDLPAKADREYATVLAAAETRRIGVEVEFTHAPLGKQVRVPIACYFYWPDGQTSPPLNLNYEPQETWPGGYAAGGMGWDQPGQWPPGVYTIVCMIYGRPVAVDRLVIE